MKTIKLFVFFIFCVSQSFGLVQMLNEPLNKKEIMELKVRNGLPNFFDKIQQGVPIKVAYLGGSITAQKGWRVYSLQWMQKQYPQIKFTEINAAIGGTGSDFGVFRLKNHVLKFKPDLIFIEFAVNDSKTSSERIIRSIEGIVRQIWHANRRIDICFIYTIKEDFLETEQCGGLPTSAIEMEKVANKYKIPSINFGVEVAKQVTEGKLIFTGKEKEVEKVKVFSLDGVHPYIETGHIIYQEVLKRSFEKMAPKSKTSPFDHKIGKAITINNFSNAQMLDYSKFELSKDWEIINVSTNPEFSGFSKYLNSIAKSNSTGQSITVHFTGQAIGFFDIMGFDAGRVIVEVDGIIKDTILRFDSYCTYRRINYFLIDHLEYKNHVVVFKTFSEPFDKTAIITIKEDIAENPRKYQENNWYLGKVLLDGELH